MNIERKCSTYETYINVAMSPMEALGLLDLLQAAEWDYRLSPSMLDMVKQLCVVLGKQQGDV